MVSPPAIGAVLLCACLLQAAAGPFSPARAGIYRDSSHGNSTYGVNRSATAALGYGRGNCAHCHEPHASIQGSEPAPAGGPDTGLLMAPANAGQADNVCLRCHTDTASLNTSPITNRSYSYRAGAWTADPVNDMQEIFATASPGTSHNLNDIATFIDGRWGYKSGNQPCTACHNPHGVQGDPANAPNDTKSSTSRGWAASRPSLHSTNSTSWGLWGDDPAERMDAYDANYQPPYRYSSTTTLEPVGDGVANRATAAANTVDWVTFCTDCHNSTNTIYSSTLGRNLRTFDWSQDVHGKGAANNDSGDDVKDPYQDASLGAYALSCLDCHEPHGSPNTYLLRQEVNGYAPVTVTTLTSTNPWGGSCNKEWVDICGQCHTKLGGGDGHIHPDPLPGLPSCASVCHPGGACIYQPCGTCHYHGNRTIPGSTWNSPLF